MSCESLSGGPGQHRPASGLRPGTGSLGTAPLISARPVTQQGLSGIRGSPGIRHVQDAQFFFGKLGEKRTKIIDMNEHLRDELLDLQKSRSRQLEMVDRLQELKDEVRKLELQFSDYNSIVQRATMQSTAAEVQESIAAVNVRR
jgi:hypothetical protein